jgi:hypothetical protein
MKTIQPRQPAQPQTLDDLAIDMTPRVVVDELAALQLDDATTRGYARFSQSLPSIAAMTARAKHHADEAARFVTMVHHSDRESFNRNAYQLFAVTQLNNVGSLAIALIPARTAVDRHAQREHGYAVLGTLDAPEDNPLRRAVETAFGLTGIDAAEIASDAIAYAARRTTGQGTPSRATTHRLEERRALEDYMFQLPSTADLIAVALRHGEMAASYAASLDDGDLGPEAYELATAAREGALLQQHIALARFVMSTPNIDLIDAHASLRPAIASAPDRVRAVLELAETQGNHMRTMIASHPY